MLGRMHVFEASGAGSKIGHDFLRNMGQVVVHHHPDEDVGRVMSSIFFSSPMNSTLRWRFSIFAKICPVCRSIPARIDTVPRCTYS